MSGYNGRRGPNVSAYVANLNTIAPEDVHEPKLDPDFSLFLDTEYFDQFDAGNNVDLNSPLDIDLNIEAPASSRENRTLPAASANEPKMDFNLNGDFQFADFSNFSQPLNIDPSIQTPLPTSGAYPVGTAYTSPVSSAVSPIIPGFDQAADETSRVAAEEDKRRRNTAASARFRIKKKQREQALEKTAKEMTERVSVLETRIQQLETENTWLKSLITEKNGGKTSSSEIRAMLTKHEEKSERSNGNRTDGVGTKTSGSKA
ncbi:hypothetical protein N0V90_008209 [Kalmusia sp. IMI 367209]|nr:hypothetical protein N0V90_008209 [Kalmusia sp. IMI 367209]